MRVAVAMSGGVDSAVAAMLLHEQGHEVIGLSMQLVDQSEQEASRCCSGQDLLDARKVAWKLGFRHHILDFEEIFQDKVREPFVASYLDGETPIPCLECNTEVKFKPLLARARALGCEQIATGHYARIVTGDDGHRRIARATDRSKDQSYYLYELSSEILSMAVFPLGEMEKVDTRRLAREAGLPIADKPESQEICFVPEGERYDSIVDRAADDTDRSGWLVDKDGERLAPHDGYHRFTIGQRRKLGAAFGERRYVLAIDPRSHDVVIGSDKDLEVDEVHISRVHWTGPRVPRTCAARMRSHGQLHSASIEFSGDQASLRLASGQRRTAPGQALVCYDGDVVLGGGRVLRSEFPV